MKRLLNLFAKNLPFLTKKVAFFTVLYAQHHFTSLQSSIKCASSPQILRRNIQSIREKLIKIYQNGRLVGYAYCFANNYLVTVSQQMLQKSKHNKTYEYFNGGQKLKGSFRVVGSFQNLVFIECTLSDKVSQLIGDSERPSSYSQIQIIKQKQFLSLKRGFFITEDSGYGIVDGQGELGSLVTNNNGVAGIVVQVGSQSLKGFLRIIEWRHLLPILQHVKGKPLHLGISVQAMESHQGVSVVRIAPNSLFKNDIMMGDIITRVNGHQFRDPQSLQRVCIESEGTVQIILEREGKQVEVKIQL